MLHFKSSPAKSVVFADDHSVLLPINGKDVEWLSRGKAEALALADGEIVHAVVAADDFAFFVHDFAFCIV